LQGEEKKRNGGRAAEERGETGKGEKVMPPPWQRIKGWGGGKTECTSPLEREQKKREVRVLVDWNMFVFSGRHGEYGTHLSGKNCPTQGREVSTMSNKRKQIRRRV